METIIALHSPLANLGYGLTCILFCSTPNKNSMVISETRRITLIDILLGKSLCNKFK